MPANTTELEKRLWGAADELRANSKLKSSEYSVPVLGLIFLRYADHKFALAKAKLSGQNTGRRIAVTEAVGCAGAGTFPVCPRFVRLPIRMRWRNWLNSLPLEHCMAMKSGTYFIRHQVA